MPLTPAILRPVRIDDDLDAINAGSPTWTGSALTRRIIGSADPEGRVWLVAEIDGVVAGYVHARRENAQAATQDARVYLWVRANFRRKGIGHQLWLATREPLANAGVERFLSFADADDRDSVGWAHSLGAELGAERLQSVLDLASVSTDATTEQRGASISVLPGDASDDDWRDLYTAYTRASGDTPDGQAGRSPMPSGMFRTYVAEPWQGCVARDDDGRIVGMTAVFVRNSASREVNTLITGVDREWRGKGLATAMKREHARILSSSGWRSLVTQNMVGNEPILAANKRLGFRPSTTLVDVVLRPGER